MKKGKSILTRCLALALALVLIASSANLGTVLKVFAAEQTTVKVSELVVSNYELTDAEKALITSGNLVDANITYTAFDAKEANVTVDTAAKTITAPDYEGWVPYTVELITADDTAVNITNEGGGVYSHDYPGNAYSVKVTYKLELTADESVQTAQLNAAGTLKDNLANQKSAAAADMSGVLEGMDTLVAIANGEIKAFNAYQVEFYFEETTAAVKAMEEDLEANGGKLTLQVLQEGYNSADSKSQYLIESGAEFKAAVDQVYEWLTWLNHEKEIFRNDTVIGLLESDANHAQTAIMVKGYAGILDAAVQALEGCAQIDWADNAGYLSDAVNYTDLDAKIAALDSISSNTVKNPLLFGYAEAQVDLSMKNVTVHIIQKDVTGEANSAELKVVAEATVKKTLAEGVGYDAIQAAVAAIDAETTASWNTANCAPSVWTAIPDTLTEDITVTVTYSPKTLTISSNYAEDVEVPYGYKLQFADHEDASKSYDYKIGEDSYIQGDEIIVTEDIEITRTEGRAYTKLDLYTQVGLHYGNDTVYNILSSGALLDNEDIYVRMPNDSDKLLLLKANTLTASVPAFDSKWEPYTYGDGTAMTEFNGTASWTADEVVVIYKRDLDDMGYTDTDTAEILALAETLQSEANGQLSALSGLFTNLDQMSQITKTVFNGLGGIISGETFFEDDAEKDAAMKALLSEVISGIINDCVETDGKLKLYNLLLNAPKDSNAMILLYYYQNSEQILSELNKLVVYLNRMLEADSTFTADEKLGALQHLCGLVPGFEDYANQIVELKEDMNTGLNDLVEPNEKIDLTISKLANLTEALAANGEIACQTADVPYVVSDMLRATDASKAQVVVTVKVKDKTLSYTTPAQHFGYVLTSAELSTLADQINAGVAEVLGDAMPYYSVVKSVDVMSLVGTELTEEGNISVTYTYSPISYTVKIEGEADQTVTAESLVVTLPAYPTSAKVYKYYLNGKDITASLYQFKLSELGTLFTNGVCTIDRQVVLVAEDTLAGNLANLTSGNVYTTVQDENGDTIKLTAQVAGSKDGILGFAFDLVQLGYTYIGLNGEDFLYTVDANGVEALEISIQTLINAIMADTEFGSETLIELGNNNGGKVMTASLQLGQSKDELDFTDIEFVLELDGVPGKMVTVANGLNAVKNNMSFQSAGTYMDVQLHLPEKVYEVYLTALWGTGELDKSDINAINNQIAFHFLYDYIMLIAESDVTAETFQNTLEIFDAAANEVLDKDIPDYDLTQYDQYLQLVKKALTSEGVQINANEKDTTITVTGQGKHVLTLVDAIGLDISSYESLVGMVKEFKDGNTLTGTVKATLDNFDTNFEALIVDVDAAIEGAKEIKNIEDRYDAANEAVDLVKGLGLANGIDYTSDLSARVDELTGKAVIFLLDDIEDTLVLDDTTIIDLNGKDVNNIVANGHVYIMDSTLDTLNAGTVNTVSGNLTIIAGNYGTDVSAYLPDGYKQVGTNVQNALYTIESLSSGDLNFTVNTDVMYDESVEGYLPTVRGLAVDIAADIALNYYLTAMMAIDGNEIANIDFDDVIGIIERTETATEAINEVLCMFNAEGTSAFINAVSDDLLDFAAIESAINSGEKVASYDVTIAPYGIELYHNTEGDYLTFNVGSVDSKAWTFEVSLTLDGENKAKVAKVAGELDSIVVAENTYAHVYLDQPTYSNRTLWLSGSGEASLDLDLSKESKFQTIIAVILAYGNPDKAEDLVNAIGDQDALKAVFNTISVEEVFTALKELEREITFAEMAESLNVQVDYADTAAYENYFHVLLAAVGYTLERLDITGYTDKTMGMIEVDDSGRYTLSYSPDAHGDITRRGFTVDATAVVEEATLSVKIFGETEEEPDCLWGDVNHDGYVDSRDACLILQYDVREGDLSLMDYNGEFCLEKADVTADGLIDSRDACLILQRDVNPDTVFPAEG